MKEISIGEMKLMQIDILQHVHDFCLKNNLRYSIGYGTLIGAIRHKGYIPWDDDIDIIMPRPDYDRFVANYKDTRNILRIVDYKSSDTIGFPFTKVEDTRTCLKGTMSKFGVAIDVFPIDIVPKNDAERDTFLTKYERLIIQLERTTNYYKIKTSPYIKLRNIIKKIVFSIIYPSRDKVIKELDKLIYQKRWDESSDEILLSVLSAPYRRKEIGYLSEYTNYIEVDFEGCSFRCLKDYNRNLTQIYGDYMKLPPVEKRVLAHGYTPYWKD